MLWLVVAIPLCVAAQLAAIAAFSASIGITVRELSIGLGPTLLRTKRLRIGILPIAGHVRLRSIHEEDVPADERGSTIDGGPVVKQIAVSLVGCSVLIALAYALVGSRALEAFLKMPVQFVAGALSPLGIAQSLLSESGVFLREAPAMAIIGVVAAKFAAVNLLPFPALNGGAALAALGRATNVARLWPAKATSALLAFWLGLLGLWLFAFTARIGGA